MKPLDKLLHLVEKGDVEGILSEENLFEELNQLLKYELIELRDGKVSLTSRGEEAKIAGVQFFIEKLESQVEMAAFSGVSRRRGWNVFWISFFLLLSSSVAFLFDFFGLFPV